ncbi:hypothetical protein L208DRAFT_268199 [Tricholoma matsutake]|nr:hypothetical protein L208DRAFT_268199 [Tricholoma matsutake 945]
MTLVLFPNLYIKSSQPLMQSTMCICIHDIEKETEKEKEKEKEKSSMAPTMST